MCEATNLHARLAADVAHEADAQLLVSSALANTDATPKVRSELRLAIEELFVNVASYAYAPHEGFVDMSVRVDPRERCITVALRDEGVAFDPFSRPDPALPKTVEEASIGGLGIVLVKSLMDEYRYERQGNANVVTVSKRWNPSAEVRQELPAMQGGFDGSEASKTRGEIDAR